MRRALILLLVLVGFAATFAKNAEVTSAAASPARPSGLPFDSGVYHDNSPDKAQRLAILRGAPLDVLTVFAARQSWTTIHDAWYLRNANPGFSGTLAVTLPMWPQDGSIGPASDGTYNGEWQRLGRTIAAKYPDAYVRIGWEMNLKNGWHATPQNKDQWIRAFQLASTSLKQGGPNLRVVWNPNEGPGQTGFADAATVWPGDQYVDVVGLEGYDWWPATTSEAAWANHRDGAYGWNHWLRFAQAHGKKFALPEWGLAHGPSAGGDNPAYFGYVYGWLRANADSIAYESYFNEHRDHVRSDLLTLNPRGAVAYRQQFDRF